MDKNALLIIGTFSSVYLGHDTFFHFYDNVYWTGVEDDMPKKKIAHSRSNMPVALKKILVTSSPMRIENELHILESLRSV
jgi:cell division control protein 7